MAPPIPPRRWARCRPGFTSEQVALGGRIYRGVERAGTCSGSPTGRTAKGTAVAPPPLTGTGLAVGRRIGRIPSPR